MQVCVGRSEAVRGHFAALNSRLQSLRVQSWLHHSASQHRGESVVVMGVYVLFAAFAPFRRAPSLTRNGSPCRVPCWSVLSAPRSKFALPPCTNRSRRLPAARKRVFGVREAFANDADSIAQPRQAKKKKEKKKVVRLWASRTGKL